MLPEMKELINRYAPHVLWTDGDWVAEPEYFGSQEFLAWLYNYSPSKDDIVVGISTSGNSLNVKNGLITSKKIGAKTIALLGNEGGEIKSIVDHSIIVQSSSTPRIQEVHRVISHLICDIVEKKMGE